MGVGGATIELIDKGKHASRSERYFDDSEKGNGSGKGRGKSSKLDRKKAKALMDAGILPDQEPVTKDTKKIEDKPMSEALDDETKTEPITDERPVVRIEAKKDPKRESDKLIVKKIRAKLENINSLWDQTSVRLADAIKKGYIIKKEEDKFVDFFDTSHGFFDRNLSGEKSQELLDAIDKWTVELSKRIFRVSKTIENGRKMAELEKKLNTKFFNERGEWIEIIKVDKKTGKIRAKFGKGEIKQEPKFYELSQIDKFLQEFVEKELKITESKTEINESKGEGNFLEERMEYVNQVKKSRLERISKTFDVAKFSPTDIDKVKNILKKDLKFEKFKIRMDMLRTSMLAGTQKKNFEAYVEGANTEISRLIEDKRGELREFLEKESKKEIKNGTSESEKVVLEENEDEPIDYEKIELSRKGTEITLGRIKNYEELNAETEQKGDEAFLQKTREVWKEFAVHGTLQRNEKTGEFVVANYTDLDGKCALGLLKLAGINIKNIKYVNPGDYEEGRINIDTGSKEGLFVDGKTVIIDHHGEFSKDNTSAAEKTYELLVSLGLLKKDNKLDALVGFVNRVDNGDYPGGDKYFKNSWKNFSGLNRFCSFETLKYFFEKDRNPDPTRELSPGELKKYKFIGEWRKKGEVKKYNYSEQQKDIAEKSLKALREMERDGFIIQSDKYGKIAIEINNGIKKENPGGYSAVKAYGCGAYVIWSPNTKSFFVSADKGLQEDFSQGKRIRNSMWIKSKNDKSDLRITLEEILSKMTDGKINARGKLKEYLEKDINIESIKKEEISDSQKKVEEEKRINELREKIAGNKESKQWEGLSAEVRAFIEASIEEGKKWKDFLESDKGKNIFNIEKESLREKVKEFVEDGLKWYNDFSEKDKEFAIRESMNKIFS